eukprot:Nk52_evm16s2402 gene=Nk52_evmTU16s2402
MRARKKLKVGSGIIPVSFLVLFVFVLLQFTLFNKSDINNNKNHIFLPQVLFASAQQQQQSTTTKVRIGWHRSLDMLTYAAVNRLLDNDQYEYVWTVHNTHYECFRHLALGEFDICVVLSGPFTQALTRGLPGKNIYNGLQINNEHASLVVNHTLPIRGPQELPSLGRKLRLGYVHGSGAHVAFLMSAVIYGIDVHKEVEFVRLSNPGMLAAFQVGQIDGFVTGRPWWKIARDTMNAKVWYGQGDVGNLYVTNQYNAIASDTLIKQHPQAVQRLVDVMFSANTDVLANTHKFDQWGEYYNSSATAWGPGLQVAVGEAFKNPEWKRWFVAPTKQAEFLESDVVDTMNITANFLYQQKQLQSPISPHVDAKAEYIDASFFRHATANNPPAFSTMNTPRSYVLDYEAVIENCAQQANVTMSDSSPYQFHVGFHNPTESVKTCAFTISVDPLSSSQLIKMSWRSFWSQEYVTIADASGVTLFKQLSKRFRNPTADLVFKSPITISVIIPPNTGSEIDFGNGTPYGSPFAHHLNATLTVATPCVVGGCGGSSKGDCNTATGLCECKNGYSGSDCSRVRCYTGKVLTASEGVITNSVKMENGQSVNYKTEPISFCSWAIKPSALVHSIKIEIESLDIEDGFDTFNIYSGTGDSKSLYYSAQSVSTKLTILVPGSGATIELTTDIIGQKNGFNLTYTSNKATTSTPKGLLIASDASYNEADVKAVSPVVPCSSNTCFNGQCVNGKCQCFLGYAGEGCWSFQCVTDSGTFSGKLSGEIKSNADPYYSGVRTSCVWKIDVPANTETSDFGIDLIFHVFELEEGSESVVLKGYNSTTSSVAVYEKIIVFQVVEPCVVDKDCNEKGYCNTAKGKCVCSGGYHGRTCLESGTYRIPHERIEIVFEQDLGTAGGSFSGFRIGYHAVRACVNNCTGHGRCLGGECYCDDGYEGKDCEEIFWTSSMILIVGLGSGGVVLFIILIFLGKGYLQRKRERELKSTHWLIEPDELMIQSFQKEGSQGSTFSDVNETPEDLFHVTRQGSFHRKVSTMSTKQRSKKMSHISTTSSTGSKSSVKSSIHSYPSPMGDHGKQRIAESRQSLTHSHKSHATYDSKGSKETSSVSTQAIYKGQCVHLEESFVATVDLKSIAAEVLCVYNEHYKHLSQLIGVCWSNGVTRYLVYEWCSKGTLEDVLFNDVMKLPISFRYSLATDLCRGLEYMHNGSLGSHGCVHPAACLVDSRWTLKLSHYGLHSIRQLSTTGENKSKANIVDENHYKVCSEDHFYLRSLYSAPELLSESYDRRRWSDLSGSKPGDVWSCAMVLVSIANRSTIYEERSQTPLEILDYITQTEEPEFSHPHINAHMGSAYRDAVHRGIARSPNSRPSMQKMRNSIVRSNPIKNVDIVDQALQMMEEYSKGLEETVELRTLELREEQHKSDRLILKMLPRKIVEKLKHGESVDPEHFDCVTIYFSDIVGFTSLSARSNPFQIVALLNDLYSTFDNITTSFDVYKVETIGDAYMVVSGVPERNGDLHASEIASMSISLLHAISSFEIRHLPGEFLQLRVGMHSGSVAAGVVGTVMPRYCLFGDTVNMASRMESGGLALRIHVSPATAAILEKSELGFMLEPRGEIEVKGKGRMSTFWLYGKSGLDISLPNIANAISVSQHEFK